MKRKILKKKTYTARNDPFDPYGSYTGKNTTANTPSPPVQDADDL